MMIAHICFYWATQSMELHIEVTEEPNSIEDFGPMLTGAIKKSLALIAKEEQCLH